MPAVINITLYSGHCGAKFQIADSDLNHKANDLPNKEHDTGSGGKSDTRGDEEDGEGSNGDRSAGRTGESDQANRRIDEEISATVPYVAHFVYQAMDGDEEGGRTLGISQVMHWTRIKD